MRAELNTICRCISLTPRKPLLEPGNDTDQVYRVIQGVLRESEYSADGRRQVMRFLHPGDLFGRLQLPPYTHGVTAITAAEVCAFPRDKLNAMMHRFPEVEHVIVAAIEAELAAAERHVATMGLVSAAERVARFVLDEGERAACGPGGGRDCVTLPMRRADIADYLGISTETVSRLITRFKRKKYIAAMDRQTFRVVDAEALRKTAGE